jgi:hypothetical protein
MEICFVNIWQPLSSLGREEWAFRAAMKEVRRELCREELVWLHTLGARAQNKVQGVSNTITELLYMCMCNSVCVTM